MSVRLRVGSSVQIAISQRQGMAKFNLREMIMLLLATLRGSRCNLFRQTELNVAELDAKVLPKERFWCLAR